MKTLGYYNGKIGELEDMTVPMLDRVSYFGDGVYDATCCGNYVIYKLDAHVDRFFNSASLLDIKLPLSKEELKALLCDLVKKMDEGDLLVYFQATRGTALRKHAYPDDMVANLWVCLSPHKIADLERPVRLLTVPDTRFFHCNIKTLNLIPNVMASRKVEEAGCDEAVFHRDGRVTECAHSNVHILKDGVFRTAPTDNLILPGIARANLLWACRKNGIPVSETPFTVDEMMAADEVIISASSSFCLSACEIDGKPVGGRAPEILKILRRELMEDYLKETGQAERNG